MDAYVFSGHTGLMTTTQQQTSLDKHAITMVPVILGGPSLRRSGERRWPRLNRSAVARTSDSHSSTRERLDLPR